MRKTAIELSREFAMAVVKQNECIAQGKAGKGNRFARKFTQAAQQLLNGGEKFITVFSELLKHPDPNVCVMAAAFLLKVRTAEAVATLKPIAATYGLAGLGAKMTLERYRRGELELK